MRRAPEHALQVAAAHMLQIVLDPERTWWSAIDHGAGKLSKRAAGMMKARGVKRGLPDIIVMWGERNLLGIELKADDGRLTPDQRLVGGQWLVRGYAVVVARSLEEVQEILEHWRVPMRTRMKFWGEHEHPSRAATARHRRARVARKPPHNVPVV